MVDIKKGPLLITGNWKMFKTIKEGCDFLQNLAPQIQRSQAAISFAVPFTAIFSLSDLVKENKMPFSIGAQNIASEKEGPFTGEISARMVSEAGSNFTLIGHSERRWLFHETDELVNKKIKLALSEGLAPHVCIGETLDEREQGKTKNVIEKQIEGSLQGLTDEEISKVVLAYEPVWAIGTGKVAKSEEANEVHAFCRELLAKKWKSGKGVPIQYGGSVTPENANSLLAQPHIDGLLVGGASLKADTFAQIINFQGSNV